MADEPEDLVLQLLRRVDARLGAVETRLDRMSEDFHDVSIRLAHVEENLAGVHRRLDRMDARIERIEKRLELVDGPYGGVRE
jgi:archaellum component FlaC